ncbi:MAG TPA: hypothetical protein VK501_08075 [Baekduia sp.]|uniref:hypothetical protein n=1 Tax=Baekduia sp. TaxID=2600305 RepID=UPI002B9EA349|nr:hypothetical protein [Baekduia sp.]HMJ33859.1 hypothetical protein [Baekduia sp.]
MITAASNTLPDNAGYVAAAYLVFLALLVVYVGIMAYKLMRVERDVVELNRLADAERPGTGEPDTARASEEATSV